MRPSKWRNGLPTVRRSSPTHSPDPNIAPISSVPTKTPASVHPAALPHASPTVRAPARDAPASSSPSHRPAALTSSTPAPGFARFRVDTATQPGFPMSVPG